MQSLPKLRSKARAKFTANKINDLCSDFHSQVFDIEKD